MNKKSQFYLFAAIILIGGYLAIVANKPTITLDNAPEFQIMRDNYLHEAKIIMNRAIYRNTNITQELVPFTEEFIKYAANKDIDIGVLILYSYDRRIFIVNYLNEPVIISGNIPVNPHEEYSMGLSPEVSVAFHDEVYKYNFDDTTEIRTLFVKQK
jgi:hypothetical protein